MGFHRWRSAGPTWTVLKPHARDHRHEPTEAESRLWDRLRSRRLRGFRFRRQHAVGPFIVDFLCPDARLVVEVDGPVHLGRTAEDREREQHLKAQGLRILRVTNEDVIHRMDAVLDLIAGALNDSPDPNSPIA